MYRDDLEALRARLTTLEAELEAERRHRAAAVARMRAALAEAEEERLKARLAGEDTKIIRVPGYWSNWRTLALVAAALLLAGLWGYMLLA
jgi:hypothetical protein